MKLVRPIEVTEAILTSSNILENDYPVWSAATTYALGDRVIVISTHSVYESVQASNLNHNPTTDTTTPPTWWVRVGATNKWKMFDKVVNDASTNADTIEFDLTITGKANSLTFLNFDADEITIIANDPIDGEVYNKTFNLNQTSGINNWYSYFFEPITKVTDISINDLPSYSNMTISVIIDNTGSVASCGECIVGVQRQIGTTQMGASLGIIDYSVKKTDDFGNFTVLERAFSKRLDMTVWIDNNELDEVQRLLNLYRATPIVYIACDKYTSTLIYGFYRDFETVVSYPMLSLLNIDLESLI